MVYSLMFEVPLRQIIGKNQKKRTPGFNRKGEYFCKKKDTYKNTFCLLLRKRKATFCLASKREF